MEQQDRLAPLPVAMQGDWVEIDDSTSRLSIVGGEITCFGQRVDYDYKLVDITDGATTVNLKINDDAQEDSFQRANITGLVLTPDGDFLAYNVKFGCQFVCAKE